MLAESHVRVGMKWFEGMYTLPSQAVCPLTFHFQSIMGQFMTSLCCARIFLTRTVSFFPFLYDTKWLSRWFLVVVFNKFDLKRCQKWHSQCNSWFTWLKNCCCIKCDARFYFSVIPKMKRKQKRIPFFHDFDFISDYSIDLVKLRIYEWIKWNEFAITNWLYYAMRSWLDG